VKKERSSHVPSSTSAQAFQVVTRIPSVLIKTAAKQVEVAGKKLVQLTRGASTSSVLTDPSGSETPNGDQPTTLAAINSGSADEDSSYVADMSLDTPDSSVSGGNGEKKSKPRRHSHHHHHGGPRKFFGSIFRKKHHTSQSARELTTKNTC
jgi:hypothetical protein